MGNGGNGNYGFGGGGGFQGNGGNGDVDPAGGFGNPAGGGGGGRYINGANGRIYYLDAGKVTVTTADGTDTDALLPNEIEKRPVPSGHGDIFAAGGFIQAAPSPDGKHVGVVMHTELGDALLLYDASDDQQSLYLLGIARKRGVYMFI